MLPLPHKHTPRCTECCACHAPWPSCVRTWPAARTARLRGIVAGVVAELRTDVAGFTHLRAAGSARGRCGQSPWPACCRAARYRGRRCTAALRAVPVAGFSLLLCCETLRPALWLLCVLTWPASLIVAGAGSARGRPLAVAVLRDIAPGAPPRCGQCPSPAPHCMSSWSAPWLSYMAGLAVAVLRDIVAGALAELRIAVAGLNFTHLRAVPVPAPRCRRAARARGRRRG